MPEVALSRRRTRLIRSRYLHHAPAPASPRASLFCFALQLRDVTNVRRNSSCLRPK